MQREERREGGEVEEKRDGVRQRHPKRLRIQRLFADGRKIRLLFEMTDADLYGFRFN